jgi:hypothetical protein
MGRVDSRSIKSLPLMLCLVFAVVLAAAPALGEGTTAAKTKVSGLVKEAMDAYSNLDLTAATGALEEALGYAPDLDKTTLARLYIAYGTIRIGGSGDNASGQRDFATALCLDVGVMIDPLMSTPDIDAVLMMAKQQATPANCPNILSTIVLPAGMTSGPPKGQNNDPGVPPCGKHTAPTELKQRYELPIYIDLDPAMRARLAKMVVKYSFDSSPEFKELPIVPAGPGFGAQVTCDEGQIRLYDPATIGYYIEGYDRLGNLICGHASAQGPFVVVMSPEAAPLPGAPGLPVPKECTPCPPWDKTCGKGVMPGDGEMCDPAVGCAEGLTCGEAGVCEPGKTAGGPRGPQKFYVNLSGGVGFGGMSQEITFTAIAKENGDDVVETYTKKPSGFAFGGVPLRLAVGVRIPKVDWLSVEVTGRIDVTKFTTSDIDNQSCWDAAGGDLDTANNKTCTDVDGMGPTTDPHVDFTDEAAQKSVALTEGGQPVEILTKHIADAWLVNARARFTLVDKPILTAGAMRFSLFAGAGYGHIIYKVASPSGDPYYPKPGFVDIEVGAGLIFYFARNFGLGLELPIDVLVGDGWAVNFDPTVVASFGF